MGNAAPRHNPPAGRNLVVLAIYASCFGNRVQQIVSSSARTGLLIG